MNRRLLARSASGTAAAVATMAMQYALHRRSSDVPFPPHSIGGWLIRNAPGAVATETIERLGDSAKDVLATAIIAGVLATAAISARWRWGPLATVLTASAGACLLDPAPFSLAGSGACVLAAALAAFTVTVLIQQLERPRSWQTNASRRAFVVGAGGALVGIAWIAFAARPGRRDARPFAVATAAPPFVEVQDTAFAPVSGLSTRITPPSDHYVVDINFEAPHIDPAAWRLSIDGTVARPRKLTYADLADLPTVEQPVFLQCISNVVGGGLMGNSLWTCIKLNDVLALSDMAGDTRTVLAHAADGYSAAIPADATSEVLVALAMGGEALPRRHGSPVRLLWPGRYGMLSVKWLTRLELLPDAPRGYWAARGWDREGRMHTGARIDVPERGDHVPSATATVAGVAWAAGHVSRVEVSADDGATWHDADLEAPAGPLAWTRWQAPIEPPGGRATLVARAYNAAGIAQISESNAPHPGGATGLHRVVVDVDP